MTIKKIIIIIGSYLILFLGIILGLNYIFHENFVGASNFLNWDAEHYFWIKNNGYEGFRVAFFPLFPLIWKVLSIGVYGIVIVNIVLFLTLFYFLIRHLKISSLETILYLSIPSFIFFYLPYTESVFFASSTIILIGLGKKKVWFLLLGLFLCTLARPAFTIFIPALIICEMLSEKINTKLFIRIGLYFLVVLAGIFLVSYIQYYYTGEWFKFFSAQKGWGNELQIPKFPLTSWAGGFIVRLDAVAMLFGTISGGFLLLYLFKFIKGKKNTIIPKEVIFSLAYLGGITLSVLFFRGGSLFSLNRFVFAVPFIIVALNFWIKFNYNFSNKQLLLCLLFVILFWLLFGSYGHIMTFLRFLLLSLYVFMVFAIKSDKSIIRKIAWILLIALNFTFQIILYFRFLSGEWVG